MSAPDTLFLKILLVPVLIASVTLVGRRYGQRVGGWLGSFPIVAGPILFILSFENGTEFGAAAAYSAFVAIVPAMIFYVVYARLAVRTSWWIAAAIGIVIWCLVAGLLWQLDLSMVLAAIAVVAALGWSACSSRFRSCWRLYESSTVVSAGMKVAQVATARHNQRRDIATH